MKKITGIIALIALLSGCATARVAEGVGHDIKEGNPTAESVTDSEWGAMAWEWIEAAIVLMPWP